MPREYVTKKAYDDAKPYTVSVFSYQLERLRECAAIISVGDGQDGQVFVLDKNIFFRLGSLKMISRCIDKISFTVQILRLKSA